MTFKTSKHLFLISPLAVGLWLYLGANAEEKSEAQIKLSSSIHSAGARHNTLDDKSNFGNLEKKVFILLRERLTPKQFEAFEEWYHTQFAFSRREILVDQLNAPLNKKDGLLHRYNKDGEYPMDGYLAARAYLFSIPVSELTVDHLLQAHKLLLSRNSVRWKRYRGRSRASEGTPWRDQGVIRKDEAEPFTTASEVDLQPFLSLDGKTKLGEVIRSTEDLPLWNSFVQNPGDGLAYAPLRLWRKYAEHLSLELQTELIAEEAKWEDLSGRNPKFDTLRNRMLREIWKSKLHILKTALAQAKNDDERLRAAADYGYDLISTHMFFNGSGRLTRLTLERFLAPDVRPLWLEWGYDYMLTKPEYFRHLKDSTQLGMIFMQDLYRRVSNGESPTSVSAHWAYDLRDLSTHPEILDDFVTWAQTLRLRTGKSFSSVLDRFRAFAKIPPYPTPTVANEEVEPRRLRPASREFIESFGVLSKSETEWRKKMERFYDPSAEIHRGVPWEYQPTNREIIETFIKPEFTLTGMGFNPKTLVAQKERIFRKFNRLLFTEQVALRRRTKSHFKATAAWNQSGFTSFSTSIEAARSFSTCDFSNGFCDLNSPTIRTTTLISVYPRKVAALRSFQALPNTHPAADRSWESEIQVFGGTDPEAIKSITYIDITHDPKAQYFQLDGRIRRVERLSHNRFRLTEYFVYPEQFIIFNAPDFSIPIREEIWTIAANHQPKRLQVKEIQEVPGVKTEPTCVGAIRKLGS